jgi:hypothetical protein
MIPTPWLGSSCPIRIGVALGPLVRNEASIVEDVLVHLILLQRVDRVLEPKLVAIRINVGVGRISDAAAVRYLSARGQCHDEQREHKLKVTEFHGVTS